MEAQYQPDTNDYYAAQQYVCRSVVRDSYWRFVPKVLGGILGFCFTLGAIVIFEFLSKYRFLDLHELSWGVGLIVIGFVVLVIGSRSYNRALKFRMFNPDGPYRSQHKVNLGSDHMVVTVKNNTYSYSYGDILKVDDDQSYLYVFIDNGAAIYIPAKAFTTTEAKKAFINELTNKINR